MPDDNPVDRVVAGSCRVRHPMGATVSRRRTDGLEQAAGGIPRPDDGEAGGRATAASCAGRQGSAATPHRVGPFGSLVAILLLLQFPLASARAENPMGYRLLSSEEAAGLPRHGGALGLDVARARQIADGGMVFELMQVRAVRPGSAGDQAGLHVGDQIIAVDARVFPSIAAFAAYVGAVAPGRQVSVDFMPAGGGPQQAQRVTVTVGGAGNAAVGVNGQANDASQQGLDQAGRPGLSTGTKVAIGAGAVALLGCYEVGCFSRHRAAPPPAPVRPY